MKFGILGQVMVNGVRGPVCLAGQREQKFMAVLLLSRGAAVSSDQIIDAVWDERPPSTARRQVQNSVSALRRRLATAGLGDDVIVMGPAGYHIELRPDELDVAVFDGRVGAARALAVAGDAERAVRELRAALNLWRGPALAGLDGRKIGAAAHRLEEQRLVVVELCADLEMSLGREEEVIADITALVAEHPAREGLVGRLMLALYRCGRQTEALQLYTATRAFLLDEFGVDPGRRLQDLHGAILRGEQALQRDAAISAAAPPGASAASRAPAPPAVVPAQLPVKVAQFAGRLRQIKELDALLSEDCSVRICIVAGMAGVGKTTLAVHWAHQVAARFPDGQLYLSLRGYGPAESAMTADEALVGLLTGLGVPPGSIPTGTDAQAGLLRSLVAGRRMLVLLDNAHSVAQIRPLLPGTPSCLVLITSRDQLFDLLAHESARSIALDPLPVEEARDLLARRLGMDRVAAEPAAIDDIIGRCAGLPLALAIAAARARTNPTFPLRAIAAGLRAADERLDAFTAGRAGTDVRTMFSWSYQQLSPAAAGLFRLLGVHFGPDITVPAAASLAGASRGEVRSRLAELAAAHLITEHSYGRYAMHDLLHAYAAELAKATIPAPERLAVTRRLFDHYLHSACRADRSLHEHRHPITPPAPEPGVEPERPDGRTEALAWFAAEHCVLLAAVRGAAGAGLDRHAWQLGWALATFHDFRGTCQDWVATQKIALAAAQRLGDRLGEAHTQRGLGRAYLRLGCTTEARHRLRSALGRFADLGDAIGQARTHLDLAWSADREDDHRGALHHHTRALAQFRAAGHLPGQVDAMIGIGRHATLLGDRDRGVVMCRQAVELSQRVGQQHSQAGAWDGLGCTYHHLGDHRRAAACHRRAYVLFRSTGARYCQAWALVHLAEAKEADGRPAGASVVRRRAARILDALRHPEATQVRHPRTP